MYVYTRAMLRVMLTTATAVKTSLLGAVGLVWAAGSWLLGDLTGTPPDSLIPLIVSGAGGAGVTSAGMFFWVRFVTKGLNGIIDQQNQVIDSRDRRIHDLEQLVTGGSS